MTSKKTNGLKSLLTGDRTCFLMEAHSGLSARIASEAGFEALWASGLTISACYGARDANEMSWTQVLDVVEAMTDVVNQPVLVDGDTGFGDFNNVRRLVRKLCQIGAAGVCIEDKLFPKINSFAIGGQPLESPQEFAGKIRAAKDAQTDSNFVVVARIEALIAGRSMDEALERAYIYESAGADAIFIHSKKTDATQILEFHKRYQGDIPTLVAPTTFHSTPVKVLENAGVKGVIWANHSLRSSVTAMTASTKEIAVRCSVSELENRIASVSELFRLVDQDELLMAEKYYANFGEKITTSLIPRP